VSAGRGPRPGARSCATGQGRTHRAPPPSRAPRPARPRKDESATTSRGRRHRSHIQVPRARSASKSNDRSPARRLLGGARVGDAVAPPASRMERRKAVSRRRARLVTVACLGFCGLVLATSFPVSALLRQHRQISASTAEIGALVSGNESLQKQASALSQPANIATLARRDYDLVRPGQTAYTVLPLPGSSQSSGTSSGHSSLDQGPVAPGSSESEALLGGAVATGAGSSADPSGATAVTSEGGAARSVKSTPGLWTRVLGSLEFWR
jgi:cell division protein FtsB